MFEPSRTDHLCRWLTMTTTPASSVSTSPPSQRTHKSLSSRDGTRETIAQLTGLGVAAAPHLSIGSDTKTNTQSTQHAKRQGHQHRLGSLAPFLPKRLIPRVDDAGKDIVIEFIPGPFRALLIAQDAGAIELVQHRLQFVELHPEDLG